MPAPTPELSLTQPPAAPAEVPPPSRAVRQIHARAAEVRQNILNQAGFREFQLQDDTNPGTRLHAETPVYVTVNGQQVEITDLKLQRAPAAGAVGPDGAQLVEVRRDRHGEVKYSPPLRHGPNESLRLANNREYAVAFPMGNGRTQYVPLEQFWPRSQPTPEPAQRVPTPPAPPAPPTPEPAAASPRDQLEARSTHVVITGVKARERRVYDLVNKAMEKARGFGKQAFKERVEWKLKEYYNKLLDIAKSPFAEEAITLAEQKAEARWQEAQQSRNGLSRAARNVLENIKAFTSGRTWVQEWTIQELQNTQNTAIQEALARGKELYATEKTEFAGRLDEVFNAGDVAIRKDMGEDFARLDRSSPFSQEIKGLVRSYAHGDIDADTFKTKKDELWGRIKEAHPGLLHDAEDYADTLTAVATNFKGEWERAGDHAEGKSRLDAEIESMQIGLGIGTMGEATQMRASDTQKAVDKFKEWSQVHPLGIALFNEATVGTAVSWVLSAQMIPQSVLTSASRAMFGWVGGGVAAGAVAGFREKGRLEREYWSYLGEREAGAVTAPGSKKREWFDKLDVKRRTTDEMIGELRSKLYDTEGKVKTTLTDDELRQTLGNLADAKARWALSSRQKNRVALIEIGAVGGQERNRTAFIRALTQTETDLAQYIEAHPESKQSVLGGSSYEQFLTGLTTTQTEILDKGKRVFENLQADSAARLALSPMSEYTPEVDKLRRQILWVFGKRSNNVGTASGLEQVLKEFSTQANVEAARRGMATAATGMAIGALVQEGAADLAEWKATGSFELGHGSVAQSLAQALHLGGAQGAGVADVMTEVPNPLSGSHAVTVGNQTFNLPNGVSLTHNELHLPDGHVIHNVFNPDGTLNHAAQPEMDQFGLHVGAPSTHEVGGLPPVDESKLHSLTSVRHQAWWDNKTPTQFDANGNVVNYHSEGNELSMHLGLTQDHGHVIISQDFEPPTSTSTQLAAETLRLHESAAAGKLFALATLPNGHQVNLGTLTADGHLRLDMHDAQTSELFHVVNGKLVPNVKFIEIMENRGIGQGAAVSTQIFEHPTQMLTTINVTPVPLHVPIPVAPPIPIIPIVPLPIPDVLPRPGLEPPADGGGGPEPIPIINETQKPVEEIKKGDEEKGDMGKIYRTEKTPSVLSIESPPEPPISEENDLNRKRHGARTKVTQKSNQSSGQTEYKAASTSPQRTIPEPGERLPVVLPAGVATDAEKSAWLIGQNKRMGLKYFIQKERQQLHRNGNTDWKTNPDWEQKWLSDSEVDAIATKYEIPMAYWFDQGHALVLTRPPEPVNDVTYRVYYYDPFSDGEKYKDLINMDLETQINYSAPLREIAQQAAKAGDNPITGGDANLAEVQRILTQANYDLRIPVIPGKEWLSQAKSAGLQAEGYNCTLWTIYYAAIANAMKPGETAFKQHGLPRLSQETGLRILTHEDIIAAAPMPVASEQTPARAEDKPPAGRELDLQFDQNLQNALTELENSI